MGNKSIRLSAESVKGSALSLESIDNVHGGNSFTTSVLGVGDSITNDVLEEAGEDVTDFLVDVEGDSLDSSTTGESSDCWLGDAFNEGTAGLVGVALDANLSDAFATFS